MTIRPINLNRLRARHHRPLSRHTLAILRANWNPALAAPITVTRNKRDWWWPFGRASYTILDGHHRVAAAKTLGIKTLPADIREGQTWR